MVISVVRLRLWLNKSSYSCCKSRHGIRRCRDCTLPFACNKKRQSTRTERGILPHKFAKFDKLACNGPRVCHCHLLSGLYQVPRPPTEFPWMCVFFLLGRPIFYSSCNNRASVLTCQSNRLVIVAKQVHIQSNCSTQATYQSYCKVHLFPIYTSYRRHVLSTIETKKRQNLRVHES